MRRFFTYPLAQLALLALLASSAFVETNSRRLRVRTNTHTNNAAHTTGNHTLQQQKSSKEQQHDALQHSIEHDRNRILNFLYAGNVVIAGALIVVWTYGFVLPGKFWGKWGWTVAVLYRVSGGA